MAKQKQTNDAKDVLDEQRRTFVKSSVLIGGVAAAGAVPGAIAATEQKPSAPESGQKGYQLTQHVIDYYKSAAI